MTKHCMDCALVPIIGGVTSLFLFTCDQLAGEDCYLSNITAPGESRTDIYDKEKGERRGENI